LPGIKPNLFGESVAGRGEKNGLFSDKKLEAADKRTKKGRKLWTKAQNERLSRKYPGGRVQECSGDLAKVYKEKRTATRTMSGAVDKERKMETGRGRALHKADGCESFSTERVGRTLPEFLERGHQLSNRRSEQDAGERKVDTKTLSKCEQRSTMRG